MNIIIPKIWAAVIIIAATYLIIVLIFFFAQSGFLYFPGRQIAAQPKHIGLAYEDVSLKSEDGINISAWFIPAEKSRGVILFCHGNAGNISHRLDSIQTFNHLGLSVLIFDYRGYGESQGKPSEQGTYLDAQAAWKYLVEVKGFKPDDIIIFGRSLGGSIASWLAKTHAPRSLIVESSFTSVADLGSELYPFLPVRLLARFNYDTREYIKSVKCPVMVIHSRDDDIIPFRHGERLFKAANEPKEFLEIIGSHNEGFMISAKKYDEAIDSFVGRYSSE